MGADGLASGELREFEAFAPVQELGGELRLYLGIATGGEPAPWPGPAERAMDRAKIARGLAHCAAQGITSMVNMDGNRYTLELLREMQRGRRIDRPGEGAVPFQAADGDWQNSTVPSG